MTDILRLRHEVSGGYKGCCRCPKQFLPYYDGSDGHWYCEDCGQELVKKKTATFGVLGDPDFNFNFKHPRCLSPTAPPAESVEDAKAFITSFNDYSDDFIDLAAPLAEQYAAKQVERQAPRIRAEAEAENALLKRKLKIAMRGIDEYGAEGNWECSYFGISHEHDSDCGQDLWYEKDGYELARRIKAEIEEVK